jgi:hypothetical protein
MQGQPAKQETEQILNLARKEDRGYDSFAINYYAYFEGY